MLFQNQRTSFAAAAAVLFRSTVSRRHGVHGNLDGALGFERHVSMAPSFRQMASPFDAATCMYYTGIDPFSKQEVYVARNLRDRKLQRALLQFFKPDNYFEVRMAREQAGRSDLIGGGCDALIPARPPKGAIEERRRQANNAAKADHYHAVANPGKGEPIGERGLPNQGYRPGRKTVRRQEKNCKQKSGGSDRRA